MKEIDKSYRKTLNEAIILAKKWRDAGLRVVLDIHPNQENIYCVTCYLK